MIYEPMDILKEHPIRKTKEQKLSFRNDVITLAQDWGYEVKVEAGSFGANNLILGDPKTAEYLVTAHYDTPARMILPNLITPCNPVIFLAYQFLLVFIMIVPALAAGIFVRETTHSPIFALLVYFGLLGFMLWFLLMGPANSSNVNDNSSGVITLLEIAKTLQPSHRSKVCFVLFDLEEAGLIGSACYRKAHKEETDRQLVLNLDCVGDGDHILFFPTKKAQKDKALMDRVHRLGGWFGKKQLLLKRKGFYVYPSDQKNFPLALGIAAFQKAKRVGYYCNKIHTPKDTVLDTTNINLLRAALSTLICEKSGKEQ